MGDPISDNHDVLPLASTARVVLLTPDWSGVLDASTACRFQLRLSREDILGGGASVFDPADERLAPARAAQRRTGTFHGRLRLLPQGGTPFEATVAVTAGSPATGEDGVPQALARMTYEPDRKVPPELRRTGPATRCTSRRTWWRSTRPTGRCATSVRRSRTCWGGRPRR